MVKVLLLLVAVMLVASACDYVPVKYFQKTPSPTPVIRNTTNTTNTTNVTLQPIAPSIRDGIYYFISDKSIGVVSNHSTVILDVGDWDVASHLAGFGKKVNVLVLTLDSAEKASVAKPFIYIYKPSVVFDTGLMHNRDDYMHNADKLGVTFEVISHDKTVAYSDIYLHFFVPFEYANFFMERDLNSMTVKVNNLLYLSNCYGECEKRLPELKASYLVLANNGKCPTTSFDYVVLSGAKEIYGTELCPEFLQSAQLDDIGQFAAIGINFRKIDGIIQIHEVTK